MSLTTDPQAFPRDEQTTGTYTAVIVGNDGVTPIPAANLLTLILTLYVIKTDGSIGYVNGRNHQNVLNANNVTVDSGGNLTWSIQVADTTLVEAIPFERHIALFGWTSTVGASGFHEVWIVVRNLTQVP